MNGRTNSHGSSINELQVPLDPCTSLRVKAGNGEVTLYWDDPVDKYATPEGETAQDPQQLVSVWDHTIVVRKVGSQPANPNDGIVVTSSGVRDQYLSIGYIDTSLTNDTTYYYGVFAFNEDGIASEGAFIDAIPVIGTPLSELAEGTLIKIMENGSPVEYYLAKHNYESGRNGAGRELCVRKDSRWTLDASSGRDSRNFVDYNIADWLNSTYKNLLSSNVQEAIGETKFVGTIPSEDEWIPGTTSTFSLPVFLLSLCEIGRYANMAEQEGSTLPNVTLYQTYSGIRMTRTVETRHRVFLWGWKMPADEYAYCGEGLIFPCFTLPSAALVNVELELIEQSLEPK